MATNSLIGIITEDNQFNYIYCHWDGYLDHVGKILLNFYNDKEKINELLLLGNLSSLGKKIEKNELNDDSDDYCYSFSRDKGDNILKNVAKKVSVERIKHLVDKVDYVYVYEKEEWFFYHSSNKKNKLSNRKFKNIEEIKI